MAAPKTKKEKQTIQAFKKTVCDRSDKVDPYEELDWFALSYGFFIAKGIEIERAHELSSWVRYNEQYWMED